MQHYRTVCVTYCIGNESVCLIFNVVVVVVVVVDNFIVPLGQLGLQHSRKALQDMTQTNSACSI